MLNVLETDPIRDWRGEFEVYMKDAQYQSIGGVKSVMGGDERKHGSVTLVHFESSQSVHTISSQRVSAAANQPWLLPLQELVFNETTDCIGEGSFGAVFRGVWLNMPVVVKFMGYKEDAGKVSTELLLHEVTIWHRLSHPHVVKLFGACHVGKRYFVCEYASNGTLSQYLKRSATTHCKVWQKLYEASLGLQYLHGQNIVHNDLKCDNILVGADDKAKLTDSGLSSVPNEVKVQVDVKRMSAVHWKLPEYLTGSRPTFASDIYSFAMCMLEAMTGDIPWGRQMVDAVAKFRVKKGEIPPRPEAMDEKQWGLVRLMTASDSLRRVKTGFAVEKLLEFAHDEASSGTL